MKRRRRNPGDEEAAKELALMIVNDGDLYRQQGQPIILNLRKKVAKGIYDPVKAVKLWGYLADSGAKSYTKQYGGSGNGSYGSFDAKTRKLTAAILADYYLEDVSQMTNPRKRRRRR